jgi:LysM repeat protein
MSSKNFSLIALAALSLTLASCVRSASTPPPATPTVNSLLPAETPTFDPLAELGLAATQTVQASLGTVFPNETSSFGTPIATVGGVLLPTATPIVVGSPVVGTPAPTYAYTSVPRPATYTLQSGEFPYCIARRFNINPGELLDLNGITDGGLFQPGLTLQIPQTSSPFPPPTYLIPHPATYTVLSGDTIYGVACKYGDVDPLAIAAANGLLSPYTLTAGQTLQIP